MYTIEEIQTWVVDSNDGWSCHPDGNVRIYIHPMVAHIATGVRIGSGVVIGEGIET